MHKKVTSPLTQLARAVPLRVGALLAVAGAVTLPVSTLADSPNEKSVLVAPFRFPRTDNSVNWDPADQIRDAYNTKFEQFWEENSYGLFEVTTKTYGYTNMQWPKNPAAGATEGPDLNQDSFGANPLVPGSNGEVFSETSFPYGGPDTPVTDGW